MRVVIAEDSALLRQGLVEILARREHTVVAAVGDAEALLTSVSENAPDLALVDVRLPPGYRDEGLRAALRLRRDHPEVGILVLSQYVEPTYATELLEVATSGLGYLLKDRVGDLAQLLSALREVAAGGSVIDPQVVEALVTRRARLRESPLARLTPRELDVLREMAQGRGNAGIAQALFLSESSVEKHVNAIFAKLDLASEQQVNRRVAAVLTFLRDSGLRTPG